MPTAKFLNPDFDNEIDDDYVAEEDEEKHDASNIEEEEEEEDEEYWGLKSPLPSSSPTGPVLNGSISRVQNNTSAIQNQQTSVATITRNSGGTVELQNVTLPSSTTTASTTNSTSMTIEQRRQFYFAHFGNSTSWHSSVSEYIILIATFS